MTGDHPYGQARLSAAMESTRQLRRLERSYRRVATEQPGTLDRRQLVHWSAVRAELQERGRRVPGMHARPQRWRPRT